jgi:hypothetical protein
VLSCRLFQPQGLLSIITSPFQLPMRVTPNHLPLSQR